jgi:Type I phosphodiesterase / nucleotide pyrophosphatase
MHKAFRWMRVCLVMALAAALEAAPRPKLVLGIVVDQFRYDYLTRFRSDYHAGFERLLTRGAVFTNAHFIHLPTVTAVGHSTFLTGATPAMSGIVGNEWYDRAAAGMVTSVSDRTVQLLGAGGTGSSPARLLVSTLGDELKIAHPDSKVIGISLKDRSAILSSGHMADAAYWMDVSTGNFVSSTFYFAQLPGWVKDFNASRPEESYRGARWLNHVIPEKGAVSWAVAASPFGNDLLERFTERAIQAERLGQRGATDLLTVSFSSNDIVGHALGPDSPEVKAISIETDQALGKLFAFLDSTVGMANVLVIMTGDHGVAPLPEVSAARKMPGGRMPHGIVQSTVQAALTARFGEGRWIAAPSEFTLYFNQDLIRDKKLDPAEVDRVAAEAARHIPHVFRVYTREQLLSGVAMEDPVGRAVMNGFYGPRSGDLFVVAEPYWIFFAKGTTHGTAFGYDTHVPLIFMGPGIRTGRFNEPVAINDVAPTLATYLDVETPSGSVGRCLAEILPD